MDEHHDWRILVDFEPAASGSAPSLFEAHAEIARCALEMFPNEGADAMCQIRRPGGDWFAIDAAWEIVK